MNIFDRLLRFILKGQMKGAVEVFFKIWTYSRFTQVFRSVIFEKKLQECAKIRLCDKRFSGGIWILYNRYLLSILSAVKLSRMYDVMI